MSTYEYSTIWINTNSTHLLNKLKFINPNTTFLLNRVVVSTYLSDFIKLKKNVQILVYNQIDVNYKKPKKKNFF